MAVCGSENWQKGHCVNVCEGLVQRSNSDALAALARLLEPLLGELVFVGGAVTCILVTDEGAGEPRPTLDVDAIAEITSYAEYATFGERLRALGFSEDTGDGAPLCRWVHSGMVLDVMPLDEAILGFSNRWYREAMNTAIGRKLPDGLTVQVVNGPHFLATKLEAFHGRGAGDFCVSHDLEDLIFVIDGRPGVIDEVHMAAAPLRAYLSAQFQTLLETPSFIDALPGHLLPDAASQARLPIILGRMQLLTE